MAGKTTFLEIQALNSELRALALTVSGSNASTSNILVTSSTGAKPGDVFLFSVDSTYHRVTAVPDGTHITVAPAFGSAPTTGTATHIAYAPLALWVGLFSATPSDAGGGTEATGGSYARVQVTQADASWAAPSGTPSSTSNSSAVTFPASTGAVSAGASLGWFGVFDAPSAGNLLWWGAIATPQSIAASGITLSFAIGALVRTED